MLKSKMTQAQRIKFYETIECRRCGNNINKSANPTGLCPNCLRDVNEEARIRGSRMAPHIIEY